MSQIRLLPDGFHLHTRLIGTTIHEDHDLGANLFGCLELERAAKGIAQHGDYSSSRQKCSSSSSSCAQTAVLVFFRSSVLGHGLYEVPIEDHFGKGISVAIFNDGLYLPGKHTHTLTTQRSWSPATTTAVQLYIPSKPGFCAHDTMSLYK